MVRQEPFAVEQFMDKYESDISYNMAETCVDSLSISEIMAMSHSAATTTIDDLVAKKLTYGHIKGSPELRENIAALYKGSGITADDVVVTNGAIGANFLTFYGVVNVDDHVIVVSPTYQQLSSVPKMFGAKVDLFDIAAEDEYKPRLDELQKLIKTNKTRLLVINNPNNPSGYVWENDTLEKIVAICKEENVVLMGDEVYRPLYHFETSDPIKSVVGFGYDNTIATGSMSKAFSLAGLRLGWIVTKNEEFKREFWEKRDYNTISVSVLDDFVASVALSNVDKILERNHKICATNLELLQTFINEHKEHLSWIKPRGGSTCFVKLNVKVSTMEFAEKFIQKHKSLLVPGEVFGKPGWLRIGFGNSTKDIAGGLEQLAEFLKDY